MRLPNPQGRAGEQSLKRGTGGWDTLNHNRPTQRFSLTTHLMAARRTHTDAILLQGHHYRRTISSIGDLSPRSSRAFMAPGLRQGGGSSAGFASPREQMRTATGEPRRLDLGPCRHKGNPRQFRLQSSLFV